LGRKIVAEALRQRGERVEIHDDHFPQNAKDPEWLAEVGKRGWIVLTKDTRIHYRANEMNALLTANVRAFVVTARGDLQGKEIAAIFIQALPAIKRLLAKSAAPFLANLNREGKVLILKSAAAD
jgi:hypothetical protein